MNLSKLICSQVLSEGQKEVERDGSLSLLVSIMKNKFSLFPYYGDYESKNSAKNGVFLVNGGAKRVKGRRKNPARLTLLVYQDFKNKLYFQLFNFKTKKLVKIRAINLGLIWDRENISKVFEEDQDLSTTFGRSVQVIGKTELGKVRFF